MFYFFLGGGRIVISVKNNFNIFGNSIISSNGYPHETNFSLCENKSYFNLGGASGGFIFIEFNNKIETINIKNFSIEANGGFYCGLFFFFIIIIIPI